MGQEIRYCWKCNVRLLGSDFEKGKAVQAGNHSSCLTCAPGLPEPITPFKPPATPRPRGSSSVKISAIPAKPAPKTGMIAAAVGGSALVLAVFAALMSGGGEAPPPAPERKKEAPAVEMSPKEKAAREAVAKAGAAGTVEAWQEAVFASEGTSKFAEAQRELEAAKARRHEGLARDVADLEEQARAPRRLEEYGKALAILEGAKGRRADADWRLRIEKEIAETRKEAEERLPPLLERAAELKARDARLELKVVEDRIAKWGLPSATEALRAALDAAPNPGAVQADAEGRYVFEAERFTLNVPMGGTAWTAVKEPAGASGTGMRTLPNANKQIGSNHAKLAPRLEYRVNFAKAGKYYVWVRAQGAGSGDDSLHAGLDGKEVKSLEYLSLSRHKAWDWVNKLANGTLAAFEIDSPGPRTFCLFMREDGTAVDRVVLTQDPAWKPSGSGPPESPR